MKNFGPLTVQLVLKTDSEGDKTRGAGNLFQYFMTRTEYAPLEDGLVLAVICRCALLARIVVGGGRNQTGLGQLNL